jgi:signal transduction histidine kinase
LNAARSQPHGDRLIRGWKGWLGWIALWTVAGLFTFAYSYLDVFVRARSEPFHEKLIEQMTGAYASGLLALGILALVRLATDRRLPWYTATAMHAAAAPLYSVLHTTLLWISRPAVYAIAGLGTYDYGIMSLRYLMELPNDLMDYVVFAAILHLLLYYRSTKQRELQFARLESELTRAKLSALQGQLRPHFLFNALNTVSSVMYRDVAEADHVLRQLADLLRSSLRSTDTHEVLLRDEIEMLELYLSVMRARFEDRLSVDVDADAGLHSALVPYLLLQPLVENALEHGNPGPGRDAHIRVSVRRDKGDLCLSVEDNGPGLAPAARINGGSGIGLRNTAARLEHLYGRRQRLSFSSGKQGGLLVDVRIPYRERAAAAAMENGD